MKKICMVSTHGYFDSVPELGRTDTGGQVVFVLELGKALTTYGIKVDIYTRWFDKAKKQIEPVFDCPDVRVIRIHSGEWKFVRKEDIYDVLPKLEKNMIAFIEKNNLDYDIFHGHYVDGGIVAIDVAFHFKKPSFFTAHSLGAWKKARMGGDPIEMEKLYHFKHRIKEEKRVFRSVVAQTATTAIQKELFKKYYNFESNNIEVIPPGVNVHIYKPLNKDEKENQLSTPEKYIFCLSRIDANKGHDYLLYAFDIVRSNIKDIHLIIGGGSPKPKQVELEVKAKMREIISEHEMEDRVRIIGYVPDELMAPYYRQAELFVLPSKFEPFGMTALEAMACGTPVITSNLGGIKENFTSGKDGILVDPSNKEELAESMINLLNDTEFADKIGKEGYKTVKEKFSWEAIAKRTLEFYESYLQ
ncbi:Mannosylfructose-phosphate synthase [subsurface metagenome]